MSKGSNRRPSSVSKEQFDNNWENIFGKRSSEYMGSINRANNRETKENSRRCERVSEEPFNLKGAS